MKHFSIKSFVSICLLVSILMLGGCGQAGAAIHFPSQVNSITVTHHHCTEALTWELSPPEVDAVLEWAKETWCVPVTFEKGRTPYDTEGTMTNVFQINEGETSIAFVYPEYLEIDGGWYRLIPGKAPPLAIP